jgi:hypothetical protein
MKRRRSMSEDVCAGQLAEFLVLALVCADAPFAQQFDAPYYELQKKHAAR